MPKLLPLPLLVLTACAAVPPPETALADCLSCAALPAPSSSVKDTAETRALMDVLFIVWACTCAPALAAEKALPCAP